jgi:hypothetical protein
MLRNVEDEHCFSTLAFLKNELQATFDPCLPLVVGMYSYKLSTLESFPFVATFVAWIGVVNHYGLLA